VCLTYKHEALSLKKKLVDNRHGQGRLTTAPDFACQSSPDLKESGAETNDLFLILDELPDERLEDRIVAFHSSILLCCLQLVPLVSDMKPAQVSSLNCTTYFPDLCS
jgi:hypothetical protein